MLAEQSEFILEALDEAKAEAARNAAHIHVDEARYEAALHGPTAEERMFADATLAASEAARDVVEARASKMLLRAPVFGTIAIEAAESGEAVVPGEPVLTMHGTWFGFNLREEQPRDLAIGATVPLRSSRNAEAVDAKLVELRNLGGVRRVASGTRNRRSRPQCEVFSALDPVAGPDAMPGQTVWLAR